MSMVKSLGICKKVHSYVLGILGCLQDGRHGMWCLIEDSTTLAAAGWPCTFDEGCFVDGWSGAILGPHRCDIAATTLEQWSYQTVLRGAYHRQHFLGTTLECKSLWCYTAVLVGSSTSGVTSRTPVLLYPLDCPHNCRLWSAIINIWYLKLEIEV